MTATATAGAAAHPAMPPELPPGVRPLPPSPEVVAAQEAADFAAEEAKRPGILHLDPVDPAEREQREVMLYIGDKAVTVLKHPHAGLGMKYMEHVAREGGLFSQIWLLRTMLGDDGYETLTSYSKIKPEHLKFVLAECRTKMLHSVMGALNDPKDKP